METGIEYRMKMLKQWMKDMCIFNSFNLNLKNFFCKMETQILFSELLGTPYVYWNGNFGIGNISNHFIV